MLSWVDGQPQAQLPLSDRGLAYGDGLFETFAVKGSRPALLERHLARLLEGCARLRLDLDVERVRAELQAFCVTLGDGVAKLIITRGDAERGYSFTAQAATRRLLLGSAAANYPLQHAQQGIELFACQTRLSEQPLLAGLKHLNRLEQVLARNEWQDSRYAEGLMLDQAGRLVEGVFSNLFFVLDGVLCTPDLQRSGVAGVMRAELLAQASCLGMPMRVGVFELLELERATEVFMCNSLYGVWPVRRFGTCSWPVGAVTRKLQAIALSVLD